MCAICNVRNSPILSSYLQLHVQIAGKLLNESSMGWGYMHVSTVNRIFSTNFRWSHYRGQKLRHMDGYKKILGLMLVMMMAE